MDEVQAALANVATPAWPAKPGHREMVTTLKNRESPVGLVVPGEADMWRSALEQIVGRQWLQTYQVGGQDELLEVVSAGLADAAVLDEDVDWHLDVLQMLRMIRRLDAVLPVVVVTRRRDRRLLESALQLTAFSVVVKPLALEELLRQLQRMMARIDVMLREDPRHF